MAKKVFFLLIFAFQISASVYYGNVRVENAARVREPRSFGDTQDYFHNAGLPIFSREYWTDARPPVTAFFWGVANLDRSKIFQLQLYFSITSWIILAFAAAYVMRVWALRPLLFVVVLAFSLSRDIFMWDPFLGSESISLSFMALLAASAIWLMLEWKIYKAVLLVTLAFFLALTRDTNAYLLLMIAGISVFVFSFSVYWVRATVISGAFVVIFLISSQLASVGLRPFRAILMNTSLRIYPSETYTEYFRQHGMPVDDRLVAMARDIRPGEKFAVNKSLLFDEDQEEFRQWALGPGSGEYIRFLWFYKADTFQNVFFETPEESFFPDVYYYTATGYKPIITDQRISEFLYPNRFGLMFFFAANMVAAFLAAIAWYEKDALWYVPLLMILLSYPQAVLVWAADANDVARHSVPHNVLMRLGLWLLFFFVLDKLALKSASFIPLFRR